MRPLITATIPALGLSVALLTPPQWGHLIPSPMTIPGSSTGKPSPCACWAGATATNGGQLPKLQTGQVGMSAVANELPDQAPNESFLSSLRQEAGAKCPWVETTPRKEPDHHLTSKSKEQG